jgi:exodeoxyribonuclease V beta subunit
MQTADLAGPLPAGTSVLEASAGTGKTWTIAGLVARYVAEGHARIDELLVVTFGRAATSELRSRVRERLVNVAECLSAGASSDDPVVTLLTGKPQALERLRAALAAFDSATIATTHGFCEQVLRSLGVLSDLDPGTELVEGLDAVVSEAVDDLFLSVSGFGAVLPPFDRNTALRVAQEAVLRDPEALLLPMDSDRRQFATDVRAEVERRKRALRLLSYDDQLGRVRAALTDPVTGEAARARLRERFKLVLVDEFQDTDPVQWDLLHSAFHRHRTLVVIGDPKQAIYAFRGADVGAYLAARKEAGTLQTLNTNWRSDPKVLDGLRVLLRDAALGDPEIVVTKVAAGHNAVALGPIPDPTPVRLRWCPTSSYGSKAPNVDRARQQIAREVADQVVDTLEEGLTVTPRGKTLARALSASDIAVLVRSSAQARLVRDALHAVRVPCVLSGTSSVFATPAAQDWVHFLDALEQPQNRGRVRRAAITSLIGMTAVDLDGTAGATRIDDLAQRLRDWAGVLSDRGVAGLFAAVSEQQQLPSRLLRRDDGERVLTDLRHVSEIAHRQGIEAQLGLAGLVSWLRERVADTGDQDQERSRRLDTESAAVQVLTVHVSKGLEFPVVFVPFGWDQFGGGSREELPRGHDENGRRTLFVGGKASAGYKAACQEAAVESAGEELRLLYVAMTRAVSRLVVWWSPSATKTRGSALHRLLFSPDPLAVPTDVPVPSDDVVRTLFQSFAHDGVRVDEVSVPALRTASLPPAVQDPLDVARFTRQVDTSWRRTSFSALTRDAHDAGPAVSSEPEAHGKDDEPVDVVTEDGPAFDALRAVPSPMSELPAGATFGTLIHEVLELADLAGDPVAALSVAADQRIARSGLVVSTADIATGLLPAVSTPLALIGNRRLRDIPLGDQMRELDFELPLVGGDDPHPGNVPVAAIADLLRSLPEDDPVRPYADVLSASGFASQRLRGYLAGSIDVVLRVDGRYVVVDHKTNWLAPRGEALTAWHYRREALDAAMLAADYPLQAMLYQVALHRFLRWRQPGYDPAEHLGGVLYLFLRGMCGDGVDAGVWSWRPPASLVVALSDLLAGTVS